jgi:hypothetical protein
MSDDESYSQSSSGDDSSSKDRDDATEESAAEKHGEEEEERRASAQEGRQQVIERLHDGSIVFPDGFTTEDLIGLLERIELPPEFTREALESYEAECRSAAKEEIAPDPERPEDDEDAVTLTAEFIATDSRICSRSRGSICRLHSRHLPSRRRTSATSRRSRAFRHCSSFASNRT